MPGTRAPHVALQRAGKPISTLDLFTRNFCVLAAATAALGALPRARRPAILGSPSMRMTLVGAKSTTRGRFADAYGLSPSGAVIVRPDGFVAWRAVDGAGASKAAMTTLLSSLLCRNAA